MKIVIMLLACTLLFAIFVLLFMAWITYIVWIAEYRRIGNLVA